MKKIFFLLFVLPLFCYAQQDVIIAEPIKPITTTNNTVQSADGPVIQISEETFDFGNIPQGIPVTHVFTVTNAGNTPLIISQASASCGCTTPVWTREAITPGRTGTVSVTFNAEKTGSFNKSVTLNSNTGNSFYIYVKGNVLEKTVVPQETK